MKFHWNKIIIPKQSDMLGRWENRMPLQCQNESILNMILPNRSETLEKEFLNKKNIYSKT